MTTSIAQTHTLAKIEGGRHPDEIHDFDDKDAHKSISSSDDGASAL